MTVLVFYFGNQFLPNLTQIDMCEARSTGKLTTCSFQGSLFQRICTFLDPSTHGLVVDHTQFTEIHLTQHPLLTHHSPRNIYAWIYTYIQIQGNKLDCEGAALITNSLEERSQG